MAMFDAEELEILSAIENGTLKKSINADEEIATARNATKAYLSKSKNVTIRLSLADVTSVKRRAREIGIPYQTIISSLIHQYASGKIKLEA
jgi:predicted DNA binding CopG/RHH family protein